MCGENTKKLLICYGLLFLSWLFFPFAVPLPCCCVGIIVSFNLMHYIYIYMYIRNECTIKLNYAEAEKPLCQSSVSVLDWVSSYVFKSVWQSTGCSVHKITRGKLLWHAQGKDSCDRGWSRQDLVEESGDKTQEPAPIKRISQHQQLLNQNQDGAVKPTRYSIQVKLLGQVKIKQRVRDTTEAEYRGLPNHWRCYLIRWSKFSSMLIRPTWRKQNL